MDIALLVVAALLALGFLLRVKLRVLQVLYVPAAIVAGLLGVLASPSVLGLIERGVLAGADTFLAAEIDHHLPVEVSEAD